MLSTSHRYKSGKADINASKVAFTLSAYLGGYESQRDNAAIVADYKSLSGGLLKHLVIGPVTPGARNNVTGLLSRSATGLVPKGSVDVVVKIITTRYGDGGSADNVSIILHKRS
jgi:hypothetical protein